MKQIEKKEMQTYSLDDIDTLVEDLFALKDTCKVFTFTGDLGSGKTTLVKALLKRFGVNEPVTSPTFGYVNRYKNSHNDLLYHFDLYRLKSIDEFFQLGFEEMLYGQKSWAFIEWPEIIDPLLANQVCVIRLDYDAENLEQRIAQYTVIT